MKLKFITLNILMFGYLSIMSAQENTDSIFSSAIQLAKNQQYQQALGDANIAYNSDNRRADILVFTANVYSWMEKNDSAMLYLNKAKSLNYSEPDYYESLTNVLLRSKKYEELLAACDEAENHNYLNVADLVLKRMIADKELKQYNSGINLIELPENQQYLSSKPIDNLYTDLLIKRNTHIVSANYALDLFSNNFAPQHLASLGYSFKIKENTWAFRANYANRFGLNDVQLETDFYLMLKNEQYIYFNYGFGFNNTLFPKHRVGIEYYFPLAAQFEASIGARYMNYPTAPSDIIILTGHLGKYFDKSWVAIRPFYVYKLPDKNSSLSLIGNYRLYNKNELDYCGIEVGIGNSPDDIYSYTPSGFNQLVAYKVKLEKNFMLNRVSDLHLGLGYSLEEFGTSPTQFRNRFTFELGYKLRLK